MSTKTKNAAPATWYEVKRTLGALQEWRADVDGLAVRLRRASSVSYRVRVSDFGGSILYESGFFVLEGTPEERNAHAQTRAEATARASLAKERAAKQAPAPRPSRARAVKRSRLQSDLYLPADVHITLNERAANIRRKSQANSYPMSIILERALRLYFKTVKVEPTQE